MIARWVLVHSPIVGPDTWEPVADELRRRGEQVLVPALPRTERSPHAGSHVRAVVEAVAEDAVRGTGADAGVAAATAVVGHSGAGQLLPAIADGVGRVGVELAGLLYVDAGIPAPARSRLDQLREESPDLASEVEALFAAGGRFPAWPDELLEALVPDAQRRQRLRDGIRPLPRSYWDEPLPETAVPEPPSAALLLSTGYEVTRRHAAAHRWPLIDLERGNHFHLLVRPDEVVDALLELAGRLVVTS